MDHLATLGTTFFNKLLPISNSGVHASLQLLPTADIQSRPRVERRLWQQDAVEVTKVWVPLLPYDLHEGEYSIWPLATCNFYLEFPNSIRWAAVRFLFEVAELAAEQASLLRRLGPHTALWIAITRPVLAVSVDNLRYLVAEDRIFGDQEQEQYNGNSEWELMEAMNRKEPAAAEVIDQMVTFKLLTDGGQEERECSICTDQMQVGEEIGTMPCSHAFHANCIRRWLHKNGVCPLCRFRLPAPTLMHN